MQCNNQLPVIKRTFFVTISCLKKKSDHFHFLLPDCFSYQSISWTSCQNKLLKYTRTREHCSCGMWWGGGRDIEYYRIRLSDALMVLFVCLLVLNCAISQELTSTHMIFEIWKTWASIGEPVYTGLISTVYNRTAGVKKKIVFAIDNQFIF